jgi:hypothetical protein
MKENSIGNNYYFYAFDNSANLFETILNIDPKNYNSFSLNAPDAFLIVHMVEWQAFI